MALLVLWNWLRGERGGRGGRGKVFVGEIAGVSMEASTVPCSCGVQFKR